MSVCLPSTCAPLADISKAKKDLNYIPKTNWENGLKKTVEWYNDYLNNNTNLHESFYDSKDEE